MLRYDLAYTLGLAIASPVWAIRHSSRHKVLCALGQRMGHVLPRVDGKPAILIHAVSLGEVNATRELVTQLQSARPDLHVIITTTTVTGYDRGRQLYAGKPNITLTRYPLDLSTAINHLLDAMKPDLIVLMEGEIWPNFLAECERRKIPVLLVNGRISESAFARYRRIKFITAGMLRRIATLCAQDQVYADRFKTLGAPLNRLQITGTMKFDTANIAEKVPGDDQLAADLGIARAHGPVWVCGSTGPGEEALLLEAYRILLETCPTLRLVLVPRKPERFDEVAAIIQTKGFALIRRSNCSPKPISEVLVAATPASPSSHCHPVILGDTMGELRKFYSLADVVFVGRTLIDLGSRQWGSDMIEPAALAKPVAIGPWTQNFAEAVRSFKVANAMVEVANGAALVETLASWLGDRATTSAIGRRAQEVVRANQGATAKHVELMLQYLP
jgi:3-deoxy-D-manno-octulosonic-acid transferase